MQNNNTEPGTDWV